MGFSPESYTFMTMGRLQKCVWIAAQSTTARNDVINVRWRADKAEAY